jgi:NMD protein affecting ribosome stability and mRNA decay
MRICKKCGNPNDNTVGRVCKACKRDYTNNRYAKFGKRVKTGNCVLCGNTIKLWTKEQKLCKKCCVKSTSGLDTVNNKYERAGGDDYSFT